MENPNKFIVIAALVDAHFLRLYKTDGSEYTIPQGDPRLKPIVDQCVAARAADGTLNVMVDVSEVNHYAELEKKSGGLVSFFRVAKSKVAEFFGKTEEKDHVPTAPVVLGKVPGRGTPTVTAQVTRKAPTPEAQAIKLASAVDEIIAHATPVSNPDFKEPAAMPEPKKYQTVPDANEGDTMIAVVGGKVIPDVQQLKTQIAHASLKDSKGFNAFMERLSKVIDKRRHSVEDLLKFLEKGDLPLADDGTIVAYKRLKTKGDKIVDVHSGNVFQRVGSFVHMDETMVDHNRAQDCSHGLHIARRGYLRGFSGDVTVICKINPEDVIAVPQYDANKVRVCGYHIVAKLTQEQANKVCNDNPMTSGDPESQLLLGRILSGDHVGITEYVKITEAKGGGLVITPAEQKIAEVKAERNAPRKAHAISDVSVAEPVDVKDVAAAVTTIKDKEKGVHKQTLKEKAQSYVDDIISLRTDVLTKEVAATELIKLKKTSKKSWDALGIEPAMVSTVQKLAITVSKGAIFTNEATVAKAEAEVAKAKNVDKSKQKPRTDVIGKPVADVAAGFPKKNPRNDDHMLPKGKPAEADKKESKADTAKRLWGAFHDAKPGDKKASAQYLLTFQKSVKKGWVTLGLPADAGETLKKAIK